MHQKARVLAIQHFEPSSVWIDHCKTHKDEVNFWTIFTLYTVWANEVYTKGKGCATAWL